MSRCPSACTQDGSRYCFKKASSKRETILSDCETGSPDDSLDVVILYDTLHDLNNPNGMLAELHRVPKPNGVLSVSVIK